MRRAGRAPSGASSPRGGSCGPPPRGTGSRSAAEAGGARRIPPPAPGRSQPARPGMPKSSDGPNPNHAPTASATASSGRRSRRAFREGDGGSWIPYPAPCMSVPVALSMARRPVRVRNSCPPGSPDAIGAGGLSSPSNPRPCTHATTGEAVAGLTPGTVNLLLIPDPHALRPGSLPEGLDPALRMAPVPWKSGRPRPAVFPDAETSGRSVARLAIPETA